MRLARALDHWRRLHNNPPKSTKLNRIKFSEVEGIGSGVIDFSGPIVGICGTNGVGKSTLLTLLYRVLSNVKDGDDLFLPKQLAGYKIDEIDVDIAETRLQDINELSTYLADKEDCVYWIDCATQSAAIHYLVDRDTNFDDFLSTSSPRKYDKEELEEISYLIGKNYTHCNVFEIEEFAHHRAFPYFQVKSDGQSYASEKMGKGEQAALLAYWHLKHALSDSILLIEEPETHLPVRTQLALMNILAKEIIAKNLFVILSTHSAEILSELSKSDLRMLSRVHGAVKISKDIEPRLLNDMFGVQQSIKTIFVVEDNAAAIFLRTLLNAIDPDLSASSEISIAGSDGELLNALDAFPRKGLRTIRLIGVLDGDQRESHKDDPNDKYGWPVCFLPKDVSPEELLIKCDFRTLVFLSNNLNVSEDTLHAALGHLTGEDHHDWLSRFAKVIDRTYEQVCTALTKYWLCSKINTRAACRTVLTIQKALRELT